MSAEDTLALGSSEVSASAGSLTASRRARKPIGSKAGRAHGRTKDVTGGQPSAGGADVIAGGAGIAEPSAPRARAAKSRASSTTAAGGERLHAGGRPGEIGSDSAERHDSDAGRFNRTESRDDTPRPTSSVGHEGGQPQGDPLGDIRHYAAGPELSPLEWEPPRIALYEDTHRPPLVVSIAETRLPQLVEAVTARVHDLAKEQGGRLPYPVLRELIDNLVHASFQGVVVTILDRGNTIRVSDRGPGIPDKDAALQPGFTSADAEAKLYIRGVGSGFSLVRDALEEMDGTLRIENNLGRGTVVTIHVPPLPEKVLASAPVATYNLPERQLKTLLLTVELAPVGPTRIAEELGVSTSTAYRDLVALEGEGFVASRATGHRTVTDAGLAYLDAVL